MTSNSFYLFLIQQGRIIAAPFVHVGFADFWLADQLNSLVTALLDFQYLACFYVVNGDWLEAGSEFDLQFLQRKHNFHYFPIYPHKKFSIMNPFFFHSRHIAVHGDKFHLSSHC